MSLLASIALNALSAGFNVTTAYAEKKNNFVIVQK